jgi:hypothetical protein
MAPIWLARLFENDNVVHTRRDTHCRNVQLKRSMWLVWRAKFPS